jgi:hypothetical protein
LYRKRYKERCIIKKKGVFYENRGRIFLSIPKYFYNRESGNWGVDACAKQDEILKFQVLRHSGKVKMQLSPALSQKREKSTKKELGRKIQALFLFGFCIFMHFWQMPIAVSCT